MSPTSKSDAVGSYAADTSMTFPALLKPSAAAQYLSVSKSFLDKARVRGDGPPFSKLGHRVLYRREALDAFILAHERRSTSEVGTTWN